MSAYGPWSGCWTPSVWIGLRGVFKQDRLREFSQLLTLVLLRPVIDTPRPSRRSTAGHHRHVEHGWSLRRPVMGDRRVSALLGIQPDRWQAEYTQELIALLNILGLLTDLEPAQAELLSAIGEGPLISTDALHAAGNLPVPAKFRIVPKSW